MVIVAIARRRLVGVLIALAFTVVGPVHSFAMGGHCLGGAMSMSMSMSQSMDGSMADGDEDDGANAISDAAKAACAAHCTAQATGAETSGAIKVAAAIPAPHAVLQSKAISLRPDHAPPKRTV